MFIRGKDHSWSEPQRDGRGRKRSAGGRRLLEGPTLKSLSDEKKRFISKTALSSAANKEGQEGLSR